MSKEYCPIIRDEEEKETRYQKRGEREKEREEEDKETQNQKRREREQKHNQSNNQIKKQQGWY